MKIRVLYVILFILFFPLLLHAQQDTLVEVSGVTMTADSLRAVPNVSILVKGQSRGTVTNEQGVFSIVVFKGDTLVFSAVGFKGGEVRIPDGLESNHYSLLQLMAQDTTYLPVAIIHSYPSREEFPDAFLHWEIPDDKLAVARRNLDAAKLRALAMTLPADGTEAVSRTLMQRAQSMYYSGQRPPQNIFNPLAWAQFIEAWKRGDFRRKY
ncbi:carboxypeptidase-like regulatory domain-containing protein [Compostibacter hankyongensis]|uniref:Carboxypeptidase-like regulatory domain-containing protein n=1 Tax=Compostibacter hankyongensis TaxID=1007089 RepID=A0ABP8G2E2_9BACT